MRISRATRSLKARWLLALISWVPEAGLDLLAIRRCWEAFLEEFAMLSVMADGESVYGKSPSRVTVRCIYL